MRLLALAVTYAALLGLMVPAHAAGVIDRIRAEGTLHCGAVERPGVAEVSPTGGAIGVAVELCRAVAIAVLGPSGRVSFRLYDAPHSYDGVRQGRDDLAFLTGGEIAAQDLGRAVVPGPTVLIGTIGIMVPEASPVRRLDDIGGQMVCLMTGSLGQRALESVVARLHLEISRLAFEEDVEMLDAYNVGKCGAVVGEATYLADMRRNSGMRHLASRLLPEILAADPIIAVTPRRDGAWAADVAWVIDALLLADAPADAWAAKADGLPARHPAGMRQGWRADVSAAVGSYAAIVRRNLTGLLGLAAGPNALWPAGLLLPPSVR